MRTLLGVVLLLVAFSVPAASGSGRPPVMPVDTVNSGTVYFGGTKLDPPYTIGVQLGEYPRFVINGLALIDSSLSAPVVPANADIADLLQVSAIGREITQAGKSDAEMLEEWRVRSLRLPRIATVSIDVPRRTISFVSRIGLRQTNQLPERDPKPFPSPQAVAVANAHSFVEALKHGEVLFFTPNGGTIGTNAAHSEAFQHAVDKVKHGERLTKFESRLLPEECQQPIRKPAKPVHVK